MGELLRCLSDHRLADLFRDVLRWESLTAFRDWSVEGRVIRFQTVAQRLGVQAICSFVSRSVLHDHALLRKFQHLAARVVPEHVLVFACEESAEQVWTWCVRSPDLERFQHCESPFRSACPPPALLGRLEAIRDSLVPEASELPLVDAMNRLRLLLVLPAEQAERSTRPRRAPFHRRGDPQTDALAHAAFETEVEGGGPQVLFHQSLVHEIAKVVQRWCGLSREDALQAAFVQLIEAARRFRPERGGRYASFALIWVKRAFRRRAPAAAQFVHVPTADFWECVRYDSALMRLLAADGPAAVREALAELELRQPSRARRFQRFVQATRIESLSRSCVFREAASLVDQAAPIPCGSLAQEDAALLVRKSLRLLNPMQKEVLRLRFGLEGEPLCLEKIGKRLNRSAERVRQIETLALNRLRSQLQW